MINEKTVFEKIGTEGKYFSTKDGSSLYYYNTGKGKTPMLFLHTLRTQAEFHHKVLPAFVKDYDCFLLDWAGHGRSSKNISIQYTAQYMISQIIEFIETKNLKNIVVVGESIGATSALALAALIPERIKSVYASNPYDEGLIIGKPMGKIVSWLAQHFSFVGKEEARPITKLLIGGGFYNKSRFEEKFLDLISNNAINAKNFGTAFNSVLANQKSWHEIRKKNYHQIPQNINITLCYSKQDWSSKWVRKTNAELIGGNLEVIHKDRVGHFSFLECPEHIIEVIQTREA